MLLLVWCMACGQLQAQHIRFQKTYGPEKFVSGIKNKQISFYDLESLSDHGFATLGFLNDTFNGSEGQLLRFDCTGKILWGKRLGFSGSPTNTNAGIVETPEGDIVFSFNLGTGFFRASILVGRISKDGQTKWMKRIGNSTEFGRDIVQTPDGGFVIVGSTATHGTDNLADDIYLVKLDADGNVLWSRTYGTPAGTYDEAFAVKIDQQQRIIVTGRCIADTTFQAFILQADESGNPLRFKTYGYHNQRTNAFDLLVDREGHYLITGFTTLLEDNHASSENDAFLIKVDSTLQVVFANVYEVSAGDDRSTIGEGLALLDDGSYAIGVSSLAFSLHNVNFPNAPNKNALYVINKNGSIRKIFLYNQHGSQYTRVRKSSRGSVLIGGFSRAYTDRNHSQGLIIRTDNQFMSGCYDLDVTPEVSLYQPTWQVADYSYQTRTGVRIINYQNVFDSSTTEHVLCEEIPVLTPDFNIPDSACVGNVRLDDLSSGPGQGFWIINQDTLHVDGSTDYEFSQEGTYKITRVLRFECIEKSISKNLHIQNGFVDTTDASICFGSSLNFKGQTYDQSGVYTKKIASGNGGCDSLFVLRLNVYKADTVEERHTFCGESTQVYGKTYNRSLEDLVVLKNASGCDSLVIQLKVSKTYQPSSEVIELDTVFFCDSFLFMGHRFVQPGNYKQYAFDTLDDCQIQFLNMVLVNDCNCLLFPNAFTPDNGDAVNNDFRPFLVCPKIITDYTLQVYGRWGEKLFSSLDPTKGWDGRQNGKSLPPDTYMYQCQYTLRYSEEISVQRTVKGNITLLR